MFDWQVFHGFLSFSPSSFFPILTIFPIFQKASCQCPATVCVCVRACVRAAVTFSCWLRLLTRLLLSSVNESCCGQLNNNFCHRSTRGECQLQEVTMLLPVSWNSTCQQENVWLLYSTHECRSDLNTVLCPNRNEQRILNLTIVQVIWLDDLLRILWYTGTFNL